MSTEKWGGVLCPEWRFTSTIERPDGYVIQVTLTVPDYPDAPEQAEIAQMAANNALAIQTRNSRRPIKTQGDQFV